MIAYLKHSEVDKRRWDEAIDCAVNGMIYAKSWYLDIVSPDWDALVSDDYRAVMPLTWRRKFGVYYLYQPFFTQQLGVFGGAGEQVSGGESEKVRKCESESGLLAVSPAHFLTCSPSPSDFLAAIPKKFKFIEIQLNHENNVDGSDGVESGETFHFFNRITHHLNLHRAYPEIKSGYSENLSRNIKRAEKSNLQFVDDFTIKDLIHLFRSNKGAELGELSDGDYVMFEELVAEVARRGLVIKRGAIIDGTLAAGAVFFRSNHEYIFLFSAADERAKEAGAMSGMIDRFIQQHVGENLKIDFEGSMDAGVSRYYKSFGASEVVYLQIRRNRLPWLLRWMKGRKRESVKVSR